jgi:hypothetical protein
VVIHGDVDHAPPCTTGAPRPTEPLADVAGDPAELLRVVVHQVTRGRPFVAQDRGTRLEPAQRSGVHLIFDTVPADP